MSIVLQYGAIFNVSRNICAKLVRGLLCQENAFQFCTTVHFTFTLRCVLRIFALFESSVAVLFQDSFSSPLFVCVFVCVWRGG